MDGIKKGDQAQQDQFNNRLSGFSNMKVVGDGGKNSKGTKIGITVLENKNVEQIEALMMSWALIQK